MNQREGTAYPALVIRGEMGVVRQLGLQCRLQNLQTGVQGEVVFDRDKVRADRLIATCLQGRSVIDGAERRLHSRESGQDLQCIADRQLLEWHALSLRS